MPDEATIASRLILLTPPFYVRLFSADLWGDLAVLPFQTVSILKPV
jgi:hypothetical protein